MFYNTDSLGSWQIISAHDRDSYSRKWEGKRRTDQQQHAIICEGSCQSDSGHSNSPSTGLEYIRQAQHACSNNGDEDVACSAQL